jgi:hypothetical protein
MINSKLPTYADQWLNGMVHSFDLSLPQFDKKGRFNIDYVFTADPIIADDLIDLSFFFDIGAHGDRCSLPHLP